MIFNPVSTSAIGIVFMRDGIAEVGHKTIAHILSRSSLVLFS
jgi:hypothetical protein